MSVFSGYVMKLLNEYKRILKRYVNNDQREKIILELGLKRKSLKSDTGVILYNKAFRVLNNIEHWSRTIVHNATEHSGIDEFYQHLKQYLSDYRIENNQIVHLAQKASKAIVQAIQLMSLPESNLSDNTANKLNNCIQTIIKFGTKDQRNLLANALTEQKNKNSDFFSPLLESFMKYHEELSETAN